MKRYDVSNWLNLMEINNYFIHDDLTVDVFDSVCISYKKLETIPVRFNRIIGHFDCAGNELTTLTNCPTHVEGNFFCYNNNLTSISDVPKYIGGLFSCYNKFLTKIDSLPEHYDNFCWYGRYAVSDIVGLRLINESEIAINYIVNPTREMITLHKMLWAV